MRIFVTGATGYIGSAVVRELVEAEHHVTGLTRLAEKASYLEDMGAEPLVGDLRDADSYRDGMMTSDALVHLAAEHSEARVAVDRMAVDAMLGAAADGPARVIVYTSGCYVLGETGSEPANEDASTAGAPELVAWRPAHEDRILEASYDDLSASVIRPGMVYGGKSGSFAGFFASAERKGAAEFVGDGANRWSPVYRGDVARLYRMVIEAEARGIFHCAETPALVGELAMAASRAAGADGATRRIRLEDARQEMGATADALTMDQVVGCRRAAEFGWAPQHAPFLESAEAVYAEWKS